MKIDKANIDSLAINKTILIETIIDRSCITKGRKATIANNINENPKRKYPINRRVVAPLNAFIA
jgi:hypothetical protein